MEGFEAFELLRPTDGKDVFYVYTRWRSTEDFERWLNSQAFGKGHAQHSERGPGQHGQRPARVRRRPRGVRVTAVDPIAQLTGSGGPFEIVVEDVVGHPMQVYKQRMRSLRELMAQNSARRRRLDRAGRPALHLRRARPARTRARAFARASRRASRRPRRPGIGERSRVGDHVVGVRRPRRDARAAQRVVEGGGARVRARRLRGEGAHRRRAPHRTRARPAGIAAGLGARLRLRRPGRRNSSVVRGAHLRPRRSGNARDVDRRGRRPRDSLHVGHHREAEGRDRLASPGDRKRPEHHRDGCGPGDAGHSAPGSRSRSPVVFVARRAALPRDRLSVDHDARVRDRGQGRADAGRSFRSRRRDGDDRARAGHLDRRCPHDHVAHSRIAQPREVRPHVGEARVVRRRAGGARARRAHRARVPAHAQDADDRVRADRDGVGRDRARRRRLLRASRFGRARGADRRAASRRRAGSRHPGR